tara:strand:+ start:477 stop:1664 length:1188 start_codon:yes stop_codon:yes gene_type:complete
MIYIFSGPTISSDCIKSILPHSIVLPPIRGADLLSLLRGKCLPRPSYVHIIDGVFYSTLSVRHKEILHLLRQGIPVSGSSSMGALRAAECSANGMIGYGRIFNFYNTSSITSDDEVAVSHLPTSPFTALTIPLINIRFTLDDLVSSAVINESSAIKILDECSSLHFTERTSSNISSLPSVMKTRPNLLSDLRDWKYIDAITALENIASKSITHSPVFDQETAHGSNYINYFLDSTPNHSRWVHLENLSTFFSAGSNSNATKHKDLNLSDLFNYYNFSCALTLVKFLHIDPSEDQIDLVRDFLIENDTSSSSLPLNDSIFLTRYSVLLCKLLILFSALSNSHGLLSYQQLFVDHDLYSEVFTSAQVDPSNLQSLISSLCPDSSLLNEITDFLNNSC